MAICVLVADDHGARCASHALRGGGWGGVHFEADPAAAVRLTSGGKTTVLNVSRADPSAVDDAVVALGDAGYDWRTPPPELSEEEWKVLYAFAETGAVDAVAARVNLSPRATANRIASARKKFDVVTDDDLLAAFARWRLPTPV